MAKSNAEQVPAVVEEAQLPDYLRELPKDGVKQVTEYATVSRLKIIQAMSKDELKAQFAEGSAIISPDNIKVAPFGEKFLVVPIYFWPSWEQRRDVNDTSGAMIVQQSYDPNSPLALKAKNVAERTEKYGDKFEYKFTESLNFLCEIQDGDAAGCETLITFNIGSYKAGARLCKYLQRRAIAIYANKLAFIVKKVPNPAGRGEYFTLDFEVPTNPFIAQKDVNRFKALFDKTDANFKACKIVFADEPESHEAEG